MALKQSEKTLVGVALLAGGLGLFVAVGMPQFDAFTASNNTLTSLKEEMVSLKSQEESLNAQIAILERNTDIPSDIKVKTYTEDNREEIIKQLLDQVVGLATGAGNKFISLIPAEVAPLVAAAPVPDSETTPPATETPPPATETTGEPAAPVVPSPVLNTFGYQLAVRGTYDTIQKFLTAMADQKELLEISAIEVTNEATAEGASRADALIDPNYPIKLTATIRLAMQPVSP